MFKNQTASLGSLDDDEQAWVYSFLGGTPWEELFDSLDENTTPPDWLVRWSSHWEHDVVLTIEGDDWWTCEWRLVMDASSGEAWVLVPQGVGGDQGVVFKRIAEDADQPRVEAVCECVLSGLELLGDCSLRGSFIIGSPQWLPQDRIETFLRKLLNQYGMSTVDALPLSVWILREYGKHS